jgi:hypothetical protein
VQLVVLCAEKPTTSLLKRVVTELPIQLKKISEEHKYNVSMAPVEGAILVNDSTITVKVSLTSPLLREQGILWFSLLDKIKKFNMKKVSRFRVTSFINKIIIIFNIITSVANSYSHFFFYTDLQKKGRFWLINLKKKEFLFCCLL